MLVVYFAYKFIIRYFKSVWYLRKFNPLVMGWGAAKRYYPHGFIGQYESGRHTTWY